MGYRNGDYSVILKFAKRKIGGIRIHNGTTYGAYNYTGVTVSVSDDRGNTFYNQGNIDNPVSNKTTVVKFDKPVVVDCIKLDFTAKGINYCIR